MDEDPYTNLARHIDLLKAEIVELNAAVLELINSIGWIPLE